MADTSFTNGVTLTDSDWFNDVNRLHYTLLGDPTTTAGIANAISPSFTNVTVAGTLSVSAKSTFAAVDVAGVLSASSVAGAVIATQAQMESANSTTVIVTPARAQYHPGVAKAWARFNGAAASVTAAASFGISSITDGGVGIYTVIYTTAFSSNNYAVFVSADDTTARFSFVRSASAAQATVMCQESVGGTAADATSVSFIAFGDQ